MPILKTKNYEKEVSVDDVLHLVVPPRFATPTIVLRKDLKVPTYKIRYWNFAESKFNCKHEKTLEAARIFRDSKVLTRDQCLLAVTVAEVLKNLDHFQKFYRMAPQSIDYEERPVPLDPIFTGIWLGDGSSRACHITTADKEILDYITTVAASHGLDVVHSERYTYMMCQKNRSTFRFNKDNTIRALEDWKTGMSISAAAVKNHTTPQTLHKFKPIYDSGKMDEYCDGMANPITQALKELNVWGNKHIPEVYLNNSRDVRMKVLAGIIDTDGAIDCGGYEMSFANKRLVDDIVILSRSLGFTCTDVKPWMSNCTNAAGGPKLCQAYKIRISGGDELMDLPILLPRKRVTTKTQRYDQLHFKIVA
jgi:replicative DNA helicase